MADTLSIPGNWVLSTDNRIPSSISTIVNAVSKNNVGFVFDNNHPVYSPHKYRKSQSDFKKSVNQSVARVRFCPCSNPIGGAKQSANHRHQRFYSVRCSALRASWENLWNQGDGGTARNENTVSGLECRLAWVKSALKSCFFNPKTVEKEKYHTWEVKRLAFIGTGKYGIGRTYWRIYTGEYIPSVKHSGMYLSPAS